jgi:hypothetical protein
MRLAALIISFALPASAGAASDTVSVSVQGGLGLTVATVPAPESLEHRAAGAVDAYYSTPQRIVVMDSTGSTGGWSLTAQTAPMGSETVELHHEDGTTDLLDAGAQRVALDERSPGETESIRLATFSPRDDSDLGDQLVTLTVVAGSL